ncbi:MAG: tyrosine-type recombinase/integrase [Planctomycetota bacterium]|jgi:site-specific recombinase XerD
MKKEHRCASFMNAFFNQYLAIQKGLSSNTIFAYRDALKLLFCFAADRLKKAVDKLNIEDLDDGLILAFLGHMENERKCSAKTRNSRLAAIRTFFNFIGREEPLLLELARKVRSIPQKKTEHKQVDYLDEVEMKAILDSVKPDSRTGIRDKALLMLLYNTGARVSEIIDLKISDLRLDSSGQVKLLGKGKKQRACPLWPETVELIKDYLEERRGKNQKTERLFLNANGSPITRFGIRYITKKYAKSEANQSPFIKSKKVGPHTFRHSTAMHLIRSGNDINVVCDWLGHASINTTHMYVEIDMEMKRKMLQTIEAPQVNTKPTKWQNPGILKWLDKLSKGEKLCEVHY